MVESFALNEKIMQRYRNRQFMKVTLFRIIKSSSESELVDLDWKKGEKIVCRIRQLKA